MKAMTSLYFKKEEIRRMVTINIRQFGEIIKFTIANGLKQAILGLGAPGLGKSEVIQQIADELGFRVVDLRLAQMSEVEIGGLIYPNEDKTYTNWLRPNWFPTGKEGKPTLLLLDELTSAPKRIQVAAYQLVLDRRIGQHVLPDDCVIIALGNREEDAGVYVELAAPLANRFEIYNIEVDANVWLEDYALKYVDKNGRGVNPLVTTYVREHPSMLHTQSEDSEEMTFATPRSWARVSQTLNAANNDINPIVKRKIMASIGEDLGSQFTVYAEKYASNTIVRDVIAGKNAQIVKDRSDMLYIVDAFTSSLTELARKDKIVAAEVCNRMSKYAHTFPSELETMCNTQLYAVDQEVTNNAMRMLNGEDLFANTLQQNKKTEEDLLQMDANRGTVQSVSSFDAVPSESANMSLKQYLNNQEETATTAPEPKPIGAPMQIGSDTFKFNEEISSFNETPEESPESSEFDETLFADADFF